MQEVAGQEAGFQQMDPDMDSDPHMSEPSEPLTPEPTQPPCLQYKGDRFCDDGHVNREEYMGSSYTSPSTCNNKCKNSGKDYFVINTNWAHDGKCICCPKLSEAD